MSVFCVNCGTENNEDYKFCKMCGKPLEIGSEPKKADESSFVSEEIDGVSKENMSVFVGKNAYKILSKFTGMELASSRVSWCWPVAVLSLFFGFFGTAIWLFYRKMYKYAFISVGIATFLCILKTLLTYETTVATLTSFFEMFNYMIENEVTDTSILANEFQMYIDGLLNTVKGMNFAAIISDLETASSVILSGLFGLFLYKDHAVSKIDDITEKYADSPLLKYRFKECGGVSGGMAFLGVVLMLVINGILSSLPMISFLMTL